MVGTNVPVSSQRSQGVSLNGHQFIRVKDAAQFLSISPTQCRILADAGELGPVRRSLGKHRYLSARHVRNYAFNGDAHCDDEFGQGNSQGRLIAKIRVSSRSQSRTVGSSDKSSLDHQRERVTEYCMEKYGRQPDEIIESVGSGLNFDRPEFLSLIERITSEELRGATLVCTDFTRVCRFGIRMVEHLCSLGGVAIEYTMDEREAKNENETLVDDILSIMTHFTAKVSGNKARKALKINLDEESLKHAFDLHRRGHSFRQIGRIFQEEDRRDEKGRLYKANIIRKCIQENLEVLEATLGDEHSSSFEEFAKQKIRRTGSRTKLPLKKLMSQYRRWCAQNRTAPMTPNKISEVIRTELGWKEGFDSTKCRIFFGLKIC